MAALTRDELTGYVTHRLRLAGAELPLFDPAAEEALFQATSGLPRKINLLAHHTLIAPPSAGPSSPRPIMSRRPYPKSPDRTGPAEPALSRSS